MADNTNSATTKVITGKCRLCFVHVFEAHKFEDDQAAKYSVTLLIPKSDKVTVAKIKAAIEEAKNVGKSKWGGKVPAKLASPVRDGDAEADDKGEEFRGHFFINAKSNNKPGVVDRDKNEIMDKLEVYSGCYGRASISFFGYSTAGNNGVGCALNHVQKLADGEPLGGRTRAEDDFGDDVEDDESFL